MTNLVQLIEQEVKDTYDFEVIGWEDNGKRVKVAKWGYRASFLTNQILQEILKRELIEKGLV